MFSVRPLDLFKTKEFYIVRKSATFQFQKSAQPTSVLLSLAVVVLVLRQPAVERPLRQLLQGLRTDLHQRRRLPGHRLHRLAGLQRLLQGFLGEDVRQV